MYQATLDQPHEACAEYRYHLLRAASERFQASIADLDPEQRAEVEHQAERTWALESLVLTTSEARDTLISERHLAEAVAEVRRRYPSESAFVEDLERNGLDEAGLGRALQRELMFDAVMTRIGAQAEPVSEDDERRFHAEHRDRFETPERRHARHLLITINDDYAENSREAARARIERLAAELKEHPEAFGQLARQHSECPTAMEDGRLGLLPPGQLYPELDAALFALGEGRISGVIESEIGFHLLWCERIEPARVITFEHARARIRTHLESYRRRECQKAWIAHLKQAGGRAS
ncbi:nitrogen fixation protein NifM [Allochromatium palmeri]|uniref:peptidylprolyl isomerase n=1 Tax=Allochromatium palmeri TaxID=231048 RepID=A0A6N8EEZ4_9GAMM|nr:nitrogen fixation protein NifM [Allochromatium palmeri]MTW21658.1 nitrogen fixation protein NifM [Allochromatium palmeri]